MKTFINIITLIFAVTFVAIAADNYINSLNATSNGKNVTLSWSTVDEDGINLFEAERAGNAGQFVYIGEKEAKGMPSSYQLIDDNELMKESQESGSELSHNEYTYRIKIVFKDGSFEYSNTTVVTHNTSSMRKTWGMIKEMFR
jgi:hypothetical protein